MKNSDVSGKAGTIQAPRKIGEFSRVLMEWIEDNGISIIKPVKTIRIPLPLVSIYPITRCLLFLNSRFVLENKNLWPDDRKKGIGGRFLFQKIEDENNLTLLIKADIKKEKILSFLNQIIRSTKGKVLRIENNKLIYQDKVTPIKGGLASMMSIFLEKPRIVKGEEIASRGKSVSRKDLELAGPYKNEMAFRTALKKLRIKLKENNFPASIIGSGVNKYLLEIILK